MIGIDVGSYCKKVNWQKVKDSGVDFAMIKATQGHGIGNPKLYMFSDGKFTYNTTECIRLNVPFGFYHYLTAVTAAESIAEADYFVSKILPYKDKAQLWAAVDVEDINPARYCGKLDKKTLTDVTLTFIERVKNAGFKPMLYTNPNYLKYKYTSEKAFEDVDIWLAHYGVKTPYQCNRLKIWQYGYTIVPGILTDVDGNIGYFDRLTETPQIGDLNNVSDDQANIPIYTSPITVPQVSKPQEMQTENVFAGDKGAKNNKKFKRQTQ